MSWFTRLLTTKSLASSGSPAQGTIPHLGGLSSASGLTISPATAMSVSAWYACVTIRSEDIARCAPSLYTMGANGKREQVTDHSLARIFKRPNRVQTWFEFAEQMQGALMMRSNAYAAILRNKRGEPQELFPINPDAVQLLEAVDGSLFYSVSPIGLFQQSILRSFPPAIPAEDVFHLRGFSFNTLLGASRLWLARDSVGLALGMDQQASRWMANGARPSGVLMSDKQVSAEAAERLKNQWNQFTRGIQDVGTTAVLENGLKWQALSLDAGDLEFFNQRNFQVEDICRFFRMPPHKLGRMERTAATGIAQQNQDYVNNTICPDLERWEQKFEHTFDLDQEGLFVDLDESRLLRADIITRYNAHRLGILSGFKKPNEAREEEEMPLDPNGNELLVPSNTAALGSDVTGTAPDAAGAPGNGEAPAPAVPTGGDQPQAEDDGKKKN